jgi:predicted RNA-binding Zn ribbon-like protein
VTTNPAPNHPPTTDHAHGNVSLETAFDFLNTLELENGALVERFATLDDAADWLVTHRVIRDRAVLGPSSRAPEDRDAALARLIATRTALRDVAQAVAHANVPERTAIDEINRALQSRERIELVASPDGVRIGHSHVGDPIDDVLARIAEPIVRQIGSGHEDRIRICASDTCRWLFYDESRSGRRRWCDMATCGNRAKARRHRARLTEAATDGAASDPERARPSR